MVGGVLLGEMAFEQHAQRQPCANQREQHDLRLFLRFRLPENVVAQGDDALGDFVAIAGKVFVVNRHLQLAGRRFGLDEVGIMGFASLDQSLFFGDGQHFEVFGVLRG